MLHYRYGSIRLNPDHVSQILSAAYCALKWLRHWVACVHVLLDDSPVRVATGSHIPNDFFEINRALTKWAEHAASHRFKKADLISARGF